MYSLQVIGENCGIMDESLYSSLITIITGKLGDVAEPFFDGSNLQPSIMDILAAVKKFKGFLNPIKTLSQLQPNLLNPSTKVSISDILSSVDGFLGKPYRLEGPDSCP